MIGRLRCLMGRHEFALVPMEVCSHLRHCSRCDAAYTGLAKKWADELRAQGQPWFVRWFRAYVLRDPSWPCGNGSIWRALAWPRAFGE